MAVPNISFALARSPRAGVRPEGLGGSGPGRPSAWRWPSRLSSAALDLRRVGQPGVAYTGVRIFIQSPNLHPQFQPRGTTFRCVVAGGGADTGVQLCSSQT